MTDEPTAAIAARLRRHITTHVNPANLAALTARVAALEAAWTTDVGAMVETGAMSNSWGKNGGYPTGFFRFQRIGHLVVINARNLAPGTVADDTTILSGANGLASDCRPSNSRSLPAKTNAIKGITVGAYTGYEVPSFNFQSDGSVTCTGFNANATFADCFGVFDISY